MEEEPCLSMRTSLNQADTSSAAQSSDRGHSAAAALTTATNDHNPHENGARADADRDRSRAHFNEAMASIPRDERAAYMEAMERDPRLVEIESNPDHYLDHAECDPWKAAARMAAYWNARVEFFGDRAFLPLTISGEGAMSQEDVELLQSGFLMVLSNDCQGRPVVSYCQARLRPATMICAFTY
jgi:hypothetical protein